MSEINSLADLLREERDLFARQVTRLLDDLAAANARVARLEAALREIDELAQWNSPPAKIIVTAREALEGEK